MDDKKLHLTEDEKTHVRLLNYLAQGLSSTPMVLKGGTALMLCYGLNRYSEDLDFNSPIKLNLENKIKSLKPIGYVFEDIALTKDTSTTTRYKLKYSYGSFKETLKFDISHRDGISPSEVESINGINVYRIESLINQKIVAALDRTAIRDIYDLNFLAKNYSKKFTSGHIKSMSTLTEDISILESRFKPAYEIDAVIPNIIEFDDLILELHEESNKLKKEFNLTESKKNWHDLNP